MPLRTPLSIPDPFSAFQVPATGREARNRQGTGVSQKSLPNQPVSAVPGGALSGPVEAGPDWRRA